MISRMISLVPPNSRSARASDQARPMPYSAMPAIAAIQLQQLIQRLALDLGGVQLGDGGGGGVEFTRHQLRQAVVENAQHDALRARALARMKREFW